jgi:serine protease Do
VGEASEVEVRLSDKSKLYAQVIGKDPDTDLAVLKVSSDRPLAAARFGDSGTVKVGQWVLAVGNPFGLDRTVTLGVVSGVGRENINLSRYENFIQTDASINPGNSGGPLFNLRGEIVGINTAIINFAQGIGFAIPSNMAKQVMQQLIAKGRVVRAWLGVGLQPWPKNLGSTRVKASWSTKCSKRTPRRSRASNREMSSRKSTARSSTPPTSSRAWSRRSPLDRRPGWKSCAMGSE